MLLIYFRDYKINTGKNFKKVAVQIELSLPHQILAAKLQLQLVKVIEEVGDLENIFLKTIEKRNDLFSKKALGLLVTFGTCLLGLSRSKYRNWIYVQRS